MSIPKDPIQAEEYKKRLSQSLTGRKLSDEHKQKLKEARLKNPTRYWFGKKRYNPKEYQLNKEKHLERQRKYRNGKHREEYLKRTQEYNQKWFEKNRKRSNENCRLYHHKMREIIGIHNRKNKLEKQEAVAGRKRPENCEICGSVKRISFDHNHKTMKFRGWICYRCNTILGLAKDDINLLNVLISYLKNSSQ